MSILPLNQQVCSLELAQKLKALGLRQDTLHWWTDLAHPGDGDWELDWPVRKTGGEPFYAAYTVAELGEMLPKDPYWISAKSFWATDSVPAPQTESQPDKRWLAGILDENLVPGTLALKWKVDTCNYAPTEVDSRAKMLIYLIENNLVTDEWREKWITI